MEVWKGECLLTSANCRDRTIIACCEAKSPLCCGRSLLSKMRNSGLPWTADSIGSSKSSRGCKETITKWAHHLHWLTHILAEKIHGELFLLGAPHRANKTNHSVILLISSAEKGNQKHTFMKKYSAVSKWRILGLKINLNTWLIC